MPFYGMFSYDTGAFKVPDYNFLNEPRKVPLSVYMKNYFPFRIYMLPSMVLK